MTNELARLDREVLWHPFTQMRGWQDEEPVLIERAHGTTLWDSDGRAYIDGTSSLWCTVHGHGHPAIDAAVREQLDRVAHTTMLGLTHPGATELAARLVEISPAGLSRVFYSDSGSTAAEVALKIAFQYQQQRGGEHARRTTFVRLREAYHGDTIGSVSVGGIDLFHSTYRPLLFETHVAEPGDAADLERVLAAHGDEVAAVVVEPLVQGAAGEPVQLRLADLQHRDAPVRGQPHRLRHPLVRVHAQLHVQRGRRHHRAQALDHRVAARDQLGRRLVLRRRTALLLLLLRRGPPLRGVAGAHGRARSGALAFQALRLLAAGTGDRALLGPRFAHGAFAPRVARHRFSRPSKSIVDRRGCPRR